MIVSIHSGKGGAGKTLVTASFSLISNGDLKVIDCDVEEPDLHLFLNPHIERKRDVFIEVPQLISDRCNGCHRCAEICEYGAIMRLKGSVLIFDNLCHGCGGCFLVCDRDALEKKKKVIGRVSYGVASNGVTFVEGRLEVGGTLTTHLIKEMLREVGSGNVLIDGPPGSSCPSVSVMERSDYVIFVVESSRYGLSDFERVYSVAKKLDKKCGVIVNKVREEKNLVRKFCEEKGIEVLMEIPFDIEIAKETSAGKNLIEVREDLKEGFQRIFLKLFGG